MPHPRIADLCQEIRHPFIATFDPITQGNPPVTLFFPGYHPFDGERDRFMGHPKSGVVKGMLLEPEKVFSVPAGSLLRIDGGSPVLAYTELRKFPAEHLRAMMDIGFSPGSPATPAPLSIL